MGISRFLLGCDVASLVGGLGRAHRASRGIIISEHYLFYLNFKYICCDSAIVIVGRAFIMVIYFYLATLLLFRYKLIVTVILCYPL